MSTFFCHTPAGHRLIEAPCIEDAATQVGIPTEADIANGAFLLVRDISTRETRVWGTSDPTIEFRRSTNRFALRVLGVVVLATVALAACKLTGVWSLSWPWVLAPFWAPIVIGWGGYWLINGAFLYLESLGFFDDDDLA